MKRELNKKELNKVVAGINQSTNSLESIRSAAIFGARGANGVIIICGKRK